jgi:hypothetical protein
MSPLGVNVTTNEQLQAGAGIPVGTGTLFVAGTCDKGPPPSAATSYIKCQSINDYVTAFGPRTSTSATLYDTLDTFFEEDGSTAYVIRVSDSTAAAAAVTLNDSGTNPTVKVTALTPGTDGDNIYVAVTVASSKFTVSIQDSAGDVLETHGPYSATSALFADTSSAYVSFAQATGTGNTTNQPVAASAAPLVGGTDANDLTDASHATALAGFPKNLGPGTVALPGRTGTTIWQALLSHAQTNDRYAALDMTDSPTAATLITAAGTTGNSALASYGIFATSSATIPGITPATTRTVPASAVVAALRAQVAATGNDNQAPCGRNWPLRYVEGFTYTYSDADMAALNAAGINTFAIRYGVPCLFGFSTPVSPNNDPIFWQAAPACERMALVAQGGQIMEGFLFDALDGRNLTITAAQGALQGLIADHWRNNALYGAAATDAGAVLVGPPVNTPATEQAGQLNANLKVRISPFAQAVNLTITSVPITQSV